jgi:hypothetical protein
MRNRAATVAGSPESSGRARFAVSALFELPAEQRSVDLHVVPINNEAGDSSQLRLSFELENDCGSVMTCLEPMDTHCAINWIDEPNFADAGSLVHTSW